MLTIMTRLPGSKIPLTQRKFGTTIGGWRGEMVDGSGDVEVQRTRRSASAFGARSIAAPVWLPPPGTTARTVLTQRDPKKPDTYIVNLHETGPSYASAYALIAAYP